MISVTVTIMYDGKYWMSLFEHITAEGYSVAKATISTGEPGSLQIEIFLKNLNRNKLQFTEPGPLPNITKEVVVEKKFKYEKKHVEVVQIKNIHSEAKMLLYDQKSENQKLRREKEAEERRVEEEYKRQVKEEKKLKKQAGK